jgi:hypothetical protein
MDITFSNDSSLGSEEAKPIDSDTSLKDNTADWLALKHDFF